MVKRILAYALAALMCFAFFGCAKNNIPDPNPTQAPDQEERIVFLNEKGTIAPLSVYTSGSRPVLVPTLSEAYSSANTAFMAKMIKAMGKDWTGVFSPISIQIALEVLANGGDEEASGALLNALCPGMTREDVNENAARLVSILANASGVDINTAVVVNNSYRIAQKFANTAADYFSASVGALDFSDPAAALNEINSWVSKNTDGAIKEILDDLGPDAAVVILNALSFSLEWETRFYALRGVEKFNGVSGEKETNMIASSGEFRYGKFDSGEIAILPYFGGEFAMAVMLPAEGAAFETAVPALLGSIKSCESSGIVIKMPRIDLGSELDLLSKAGELGLAEALDANYTEMLGGDCAKVTSVLQKSFISVNEKGTTAASASAVVLSKGDPMLTGDYTFLCDRPYAMVIYHVETGTVLFVAIVNDI